MPIELSSERIGLTLWKRLARIMDAMYDNENKPGKESVLEGAHVDLRLLVDEIHRNELIKERQKGNLPTVKPITVATDIGRYSCGIRHDATHHGVLRHYANIVVVNHDPEIIEVFGPTTLYWSFFTSNVAVYLEQP